MECGKPTSLETKRPGFQCQLYKYFQAMSPRQIIALPGASVFSSGKMGLISQPHGIVSMTGTHIKCLANMSNVSMMVVMVHCS